MEDVVAASRKEEALVGLSKGLRLELKRMLFVAEALPVREDKVCRTDSRTNMPRLQLGRVNTTPLKGFVYVIRKLWVENKCT